MDGPLTGSKLVGELLNRRSPELNPSLSGRLLDRSLSGGYWIEVCLGGGNFEGLRGLQHLDFDKHLVNFRQKVKILEKIRQRRNRGKSYCNVNPRLCTIESPSWNSSPRLVHVARTKILLEGLIRVNRQTVYLSNEKQDFWPASDYVSETNAEVYLLKIVCAEPKSYLKHDQSTNQ